MHGLVCLAGGACRALHRIAATAARSLGQSRTAHSIRCGAQATARSHACVLYLDNQARVPPLSARPPGPPALARSLLRRVAVSAAPAFDDGASPARHGRSGLGLGFSAAQPLLAPLHLLWRSVPRVERQSELLVCLFVCLAQLYGEVFARARAGGSFIHFALPALLRRLVGPVPHTADSAQHAAHSSAACVGRRMARTALRHFGRCGHTSQ